MMNRRRHMLWPVGGPEKLAMTVILFETLERIDMSADAVDRSAGKLGITADCALDPEFVVIRGNPFFSIHQRLEE